MITVKNYLDRLQFSSSPSVDAAGLSRLQERHLLTVPFENVDILEGVPIVLDEAAILDKIVNRRRGGFCYELNGAFAWLLRELGFDVTLLEARVFNDQGEEGIPFDHLALRVDLDQPFLVDVGFGQGFLNPLNWNERYEVRQRSDIWRLRESEGDALVLETMDRKAMRFVPVYRVNPSPRSWTDFAEGCEFHQNSPESIFTKGMICSIAAPDGRISLRDGALNVTRNGRGETQEMADDTAIKTALRRYFGISILNLEDE